MTKKNSAAKEDKNLIIPFIGLNNFVVTPAIPQPLKIDDEEQKEFFDKCYSSQSQIFIGVTEPSENHPGHDYIYDYGVVCVIDRILCMPGAPSLVFVAPVCRAKFINPVYSPDLAMAKVHLLNNVKEPKRLNTEIELIIRKIDSLIDHILNFTPEPEKNTAKKLIDENSQTLERKLYAISHVAPLLWKEKYAILEANNFTKFVTTLLTLLDECQQKLAIQMAINEKTHHELSQQQKETFLRMHLKQIKEELGEGDDTDDISDLLIKANGKIWTEESKKHFDKELNKLRRLNVNNPEYSVQFAYLEAFLDLPWKNYNNADFSLDKVEEILNRDHYGLEKVKERILEYMAVVKLRQDLKAPILCLYGPPGVGKTSIGKSVADATGREYARIALGGMHDEAEIRGHRRTYIGAMPGRFLHTLSKMKHGNPLILLDEIDKVGKDYKGDPSSALLEALDPEQNNTFHDNFIDFPYDLSKVLFIATANDLSTIPAPLLDRMEIIEMPGYSTEEKKEIAIRHLVDKALEDNGFDKKELKFTTEAILTIIKKYTHEKGVRQLSKAINRIVRRLALMKVKGKDIPLEINDDFVKSVLDHNDFRSPSLGFRI